MATIKIHDRANELRIEIAGKFSGEILDEAAAHWKKAMHERPPRKFTVDISRLTGYDYPGCKLLSRMYHHGAQFAAATPTSLVFLSEISMPLRRRPAVRTLTPVEAKQGEGSKPTAKLLHFRAAAGTQ